MRKLKLSRAVGTAGQGGVRPRRLQPVITLATGTLLAAAAVALAFLSGWRLAALFVVGTLLGLSLYHAAFGFAFGFRTLLREGRSAQVRAQVLMLAAAVLLFFPALAAGSVFGAPVRGFVFPVGVEVALGAFLFGIGMQLGGGCGSGTLYTVGGGSTRMVVTFVFFIAGATLAAFTYDRWHGLPALPPMSLPDALGSGLALAVSLGVLGAAWLVLARIERRRHGGAEPILHANGACLLRGPWPYAFGALALAVLNFATLLLAGRPWGITQAFSLWGSLALEHAGLADPVFWAFWEEPIRADALHRPLFTDTTTVMDIGLVGGALLAAGLAGLYRPTLHVPLPQLAASVVGGLLLGFGAIVATGCNISAYFSGIASGSLHGWLWIAAALPGNALGVWLRPLFGLDPPAARAPAPSPAILVRP